MRLLIVAAIGCSGAPVARQTPSEPIAATAPRPRAIVEGDGPLLCTTTKDRAIDMSLCFVDALACDRFRELHRDSSPCRELTGGACYSETTVTTGRRSQVCFPTIGACDQTLAAVRDSADVTDLPEQCSIYRMRHR